MEASYMSDDKLSDEDKALFRGMMDAVKPLNQSKKMSLTRPPSVKNRTIQPTFDIHSRDKYSLSNYYHTAVGSESVVSYSKPSIPHRRLTELKSGKIRWEARLDLHGLRPDAARNVLCDFIDKQCDLGHRCVLIIHGKGGLRGEDPVLKNHVYHWIQQFPQVLACHTALPRDGGAGCLYVLLQRHHTDVDDV
jgi:DNA-nicking Smr family endonuclease